MAARQGLDFLVKIGTTAVGAQRDGSWSFSMEPRDETDKSHTGNRVYGAGRRSWGADLNAMYVPTDTAQDAIRSAYTGGTEVTVDFSTGVSGEYHWSFPALVESLEEVHDQGESAEFNSTFASTGQCTLAKVA